MNSGKREDRFETIRPMQITGKMFGTSTMKKSTHKPQVQQKLTCLVP